MTRYCLVENGEITQGPMRLPRSWRNISGLSLLAPARLKELGWLTYGDTPPAYDADTQYLTKQKAITPSTVEEAYTIHDYTAEQLASNLATAQAKKLTELYTNIKSFIGTQPNGFIRYDNDLKMNVMNAAMTAVASGQPEPEACTAVKTWIFTVQSEFFALKAAIAGAETLADLRDVDVSVGTLESKYGREGTVAADPAVSTDDLFA